MASERRCATSAPAGHLHIEVAALGSRTSLRLDDEPLLSIQRLVIVTAAGERTQVVLDPPKRFDYPIFCEVMDASSVIGTPVGQYVLVSQPLFARMEHAWRIYQTMQHVSPSSR